MFDGKFLFFSFFSFSLVLAHEMDCGKLIVKLVSFQILLLKWIILKSATHLLV